MDKKETAVRFLTEFTVATACIGILEGVLGTIFLPEVRFGYEAFFSPPLFGFLSALWGEALFFSRKELGAAQILARRVIHLIFIEVMVFGLNLSNGVVFEKSLAWALALSIVLVYALIGAILWVMDQRSAVMFNRRLKEFQREKGLEIF